VQPILISLREARELVMQRWYLPSTRAGERVIEWLDDENEPVRRQYGEIVNNSGVASAAEVPKQRGATEQWAYNRMKSNPPEKVGEDDYAGTIYPDRPDKRVSLKRIQNLVADIRRELRLPSPRKPDEH